MSLNYKDAYVWLSVAIANGDTSFVFHDDAMKYRDNAATHLTPIQLEKAQKLANEYFNKYQKRPY